MKKIKLDREIEYDPLVFSDHIDPIPRSVTSPVATSPVTITNTPQIPKPVVLPKKSKGGKRKTKKKKGKRNRKTRRYKRLKRKN